MSTIWCKIKQNIICFTTLAIVFLYLSYQTENTEKSGKYNMYMVDNG